MGARVRGVGMSLLPSAAYADNLKIGASMDGPISDVTPAFLLTSPSHFPSLLVQVHIHVSSDGRITTCIYRTQSSDLDQYHESSTRGEPKFLPHRSVTRNSR